MITTSEKINNFVIFLETLLEPPRGVVMMGILVLCLFVLLLMVMTKVKKEKRAKETIQFERELLESLKSNRTRDANINDLIGKFVTQVMAHAYYFYVYDHLSKKYVLTNTRINNENPELSTAYSGLAPNKKEKYEAPLTFELEKIPQKVGIFKEGDVRLLCIPVDREVGFICIGPLTKYFKLSRRKRMLFENSMLCLKALITMMIENGKMKELVSEMETKSQAVASMKQTFSNYTDMLNAITNMAIRTSEASGALILRRNGKTGFGIPVLVSDDEATTAIIRHEVETLAVFESILGDSGNAYIQKDQMAFSQLPKVFLDMEIDSLMLIDISYKQFRGMMCIWFKEKVELQEYQQSALIMMVKKIGEVLENYLIYNEISSSYINILRMIAQTLDEVSPNTVGRSEMMYRYAYVISEKLNLPEKDCNEIALAAYFSNIGAVGLSGSVFLKSDKYSDIEFEKMKLHCEVGASIIESTIGNQNIAKYILEHHERLDGLGYPARLKGDEISVGARIVAVVQFFTAKLTGREGRQPVAFYQALDNIASVAGSQLDPVMIEVLRDWFEAKRKGPELHGKTLGACWDMRCSPLAICSNCPVYGLSEKNCFEYPKNNCSAHGNQCESCFIKTEFVERGLS